MKNKMKIITAFIIGILVSGVSVYGAGKLYANSIDIDKSNDKLKNVTGDKVQDALDYLYGKANSIPVCTASELNVGDYVSITPTKTSFSIPSSLTGYTSVQTITPNELTLWRVIKKNDCNVEVVSEYVSSQGVYFKGIAGYQNFVGTLNIIATAYENPTYTVGSRMMGYDGQTEFISDTSAFDDSTTSAPSTTSTPSPTTGTGQEYSGGVLGDTLYLADYLAVQSVYQADNNKTNYCNTGLCAYKKGATGRTGYWLASRHFTWTNASRFYFGGREVATYGYIGSDSIRNYDNRWYNGSNSFAVRPILILKSGLKKSGGSGTKDSPYTLSAS